MGALIVIFAALVGGTLGSYAGVVAGRGWTASVSGRSRCDSCGRTLDWFEVVPFVSFLALRGTAAPATPTSAGTRSCGR
ncbi:MAG: prepilin peptidase [Candidatus Dormibacteria bacterium]